MSLAQKLVDLQHAKREKYIVETHHSEYWFHQSSIAKAQAELRAALRNSDREFLQEREEHLTKMHAIYTDRQENPDAYVAMRRREYLEGDLRAVGFLPRLITHKNIALSIIAEPERADSVAQSIISILNATPDAYLMTYEDQLDFFITRIEKANVEPDDLMPIGQPIP